MTRRKGLTDCLSLHSVEDRVIDIGIKDVQLALQEDDSLAHLAHLLGPLLLKFEHPRLQFCVLLQW